MRFAKKLHADDAAGTLVPVCADAFAPFAILWSPVYLALPKNGKFLVLKSPLDFFTPDELARARGGLHVPAASGFTGAIRAAQAVKQSLGDEDAAPFEKGRAIASELAKLHTSAEGLDPFHLAVFSGTLCAPLDPGFLLVARDRDVGEFERALLRAGLAVFVALSLEYLDLDFLRALFQRAVCLSMRMDPDAESGRRAPEEAEILSIAFGAVEGVDTGPLSREALGGGAGRAARKLSASFGGAHG